MRFADAPSRARRFVQPGDTIVSTVRTYLRAVWPVTGPTEDLVVSTGFAVLSPGPRLDPRFFGWWAQSDTFIEEIVARSVGVSYPAITADEIGELQIEFPRIEKQRETADFLDAETARIDALIEKKRRMIDLLEAREREADSGAVLGGLREHPLRASRAGLVGDVPTPWAETQLRHLDFAVQTGPFGSQLHASEYVEDGWPVVNPANLVGGRIRPDKRVSITDERRADLRLHVLRVGDIVFGRRGEMGRAALVTEDEEGWVCGTGCLRLRARGTRIDPRYLLLLLQTPALRAYFSLASVGSTMENLNAEIVLGMPTLVPPRREQLEIIEFAARQRRVTRAVVARLQRQIDLRREHRQALITAAVTGQLEIASSA